MPINYNNQLYTEGAAGFIDFIWLWYNRISIVVAVAIFVIAILSTYIYKRIKHMPSEECLCSKGTKKLLKEYHKFNNK